MVKSILWNDTRHPKTPRCLHLYPMITFHPWNCVWPGPQRKNRSSIRSVTIWTVFLIRMHHGCEQSKTSRFTSDEGERLEDTWRWVDYRTLTRKRLARGDGKAVAIRLATDPRENTTGKTHWTVELQTGEWRPNEKRPSVAETDLTDVLTRNSRAGRSRHWRLRPGRRSWSEMNVEEAGEGQGHSLTTHSHQSACQSVLCLCHYIELSTISTSSD